MPELPPAANALSKLSVPYRLFRHQKPIKSLEQAASERGQKPDQVVRSILFRIWAGNFVMVLTAGPAQISWPRLRAYLGKSRLTLATEDEVLSITGYRVGAVTPLGLPRPMRILIDETVFIPAEISIGTGQLGTAIILKSADLCNILKDVEIGMFVESRSPNL
jgi:prolyl-tRNA editing enzyme YbaK/EbsC (Cys-tRNA(Pro) deacylase)